MFLGKSSLLGECDCRSTDAGQRSNIFVFVCFSSVTLQRHHREGVEHVIPKLWLVDKEQCESKPEPDECCHHNRTVQWIFRCEILNLPIVPSAAHNFTPWIGAFISRTSVNI